MTFRFILVLPDRWRPIKHIFRCVFCNNSSTLFYFPLKLIGFMPLLLLEHSKKVLKLWILVNFRIVASLMLISHLFSDWYINYKLKHWLFWLKFDCDITISPWPYTLFSRLIESKHIFDDTFGVMEISSLFFFRFIVME